MVGKTLLSALSRTDAIHHFLTRSPSLISD